MRSDGRATYGGAAKDTEGKALRAMNGRFNLSQGTAHYWFVLTVDASNVDLMRAPLCDLMATKKYFCRVIEEV